MCCAALCCNVSVGFVLHCTVLYYNGLVCVCCGLCCVVLQCVELGCSVWCCVALYCDVL